MERRAFWREVLRTGGAYGAFCVGSGYATGQEILQFFAAFGTRGLAAGAIALALYVWMGAVLLGRGGWGEDPWRTLCGPRLGRVMDGFVTVFSGCCYVIMIAGAGAAIEQQTALPAWAGRAAMTALSVATVLLGLDALSDILGLVGPVVVAFALVVGLGGMATAAPGAPEGALLAQMDRACGHWALSGVLYAAFMAPVCVPFLTRLGGTVPSRRAAALGGALGGFFLMAAVLVMTAALLGHLPEVAGSPIPALVLARRLHPALAAAFLGAVLLGIYSTAVPHLWMLCRKAGRDGTAAFRLAALGTAAAGLALSAVPFAALVGAVYPAAGYVGLVVLGCLGWRTVRRG